MTKMASSEKKQNPPTLIGFVITVILSGVAGTIPTAVLASADNGYVAGYAVPPLLLLTATSASVFERSTRPSSNLS